MACSRGAHPRTRGVDPAPRAAGCRRRGSSPHAGSRPPGISETTAGSRLIPARGESTRARGSCGDPAWAHPRTRGVDVLPQEHQEPRQGSSPHAGSRRDAAGLEGRRERLIPARGESTVRARPSRSGAGAHPRTRGVDSPGTRGPDVDVGSSPHAGSRLAALAVRRCGRGLIPARGESTGPCVPSLRAARAHPRTRGVDSSLTGPPGSRDGSSPHAGSRHWSGGCGPRVPGLIPARGESTRPSWAGTPPCRGSSPHAGSRRELVHVCAVLGGLIPARGESTRPTSGRTPAPTAHPRTRGVDGRRHLGDETDEGSSPHAGSRHPLPGLRVLRDRLIPARGESTTRRPWG